jgi:predicted metal-dependent hydrolase
MIREFVVSKIAWIRKHLDELGRSPAPRPLAYESGESILWLGTYSPLEVRQSSRPGVRIRPDGVMEMSVPPGSTAAYRESLLRAWYRRGLQDLVAELAPKWERITRARALEWRIRDMRTKWGTCNIGKRRIWLALELAKKPLRAIEYVMAHELTHLHERYHDARFHALMDEFYPDWRTVKRELDAHVR